MFSATARACRSVRRICATLAASPFDGSISIHEEGGLELAEELAPRYWDLSDPSRQETLELWRKAGAAMRLLELRPERIRSSKD